MTNDYDPSARQPMPTPNDTRAIQRMVIEDIEKRIVVGIQRYGTPLQPFNGRDADLDLYEELIDAAQYAKQRLVERQILIDEYKADQGHEQMALLLKTLMHNGKHTPWSSKAQREFYVQVLAQLREHMSVQWRATGDEIMAQARELARVVAVHLPDREWKGLSEGARILIEQEDAKIAEEAASPVSLRQLSKDIGAPEPIADEELDRIVGDLLDRERPPMPMPETSCVNCGLELQGVVADENARVLCDSCSPTGEVVNVYCWPDDVAVEFIVIARCKWHSEWAVLAADLDGARALANDHPCGAFEIIYSEMDLPSANRSQ